MALIHMCALRETMPLHVVSGTPIPGSEYDAEIVPMHFDTHRGCQYKRAQKVSQFLVTKPVSVFWSWLCFWRTICPCIDSLACSSCVTVCKAFMLFRNNEVQNKENNSNELQTSARLCCNVARSTGNLCSASGAVIRIAGANTA